MTATADGVIVVLVLIESDWNLKGQRRTDSCGCRTGINRIRLEFKVIYNSYDIFSRQRINRIRLEFKGVQKSMKTRQVEVLIESDWNLKTMTAHRRAWNSRVLIESYWNLKRNRKTG